MYQAVIVQRRLTEYRTPLFLAMKERLEREGVCLRVIHGVVQGEHKLRQDSGSLVWAEQLPVKTYRAFGQTLHSLSGLERAVAPADIVVLPHESRFLPIYGLLGRHDRRICLWGHGANFQARRASMLTKALRRRTTLLAHWWFAYTALSTERLEVLGYPRARITCLNNAIDTSTLLAYREGIHEEERISLVKSLGLKGDRVGLFLGSFGPGKRLPFLLDAAIELRQKVTDFELVLIGDGPGREDIMRFAASHPWVRWVGAKHGRDKVLHLSIGKVILNPGMVGLGILDGFSSGVPLVTTDCGIHSPEIAYLESGRNGLMTSNTLEAFIDGASLIMTDDALRSSLIDAGLRDANKYTLESMVSTFCDGLLAALAAPIKTA
jgi:L-malate glycosyltransferase